VGLLLKATYDALPVRNPYRNEHTVTVTTTPYPRSPVSSEIAVIQETLKNYYQYHKPEPPNRSRDSGDTE
jgi:hypothetical protein